MLYYLVISYQFSVLFFKKKITYCEQHWIKNKLSSLLYQITRRPCESINSVFGKQDICAETGILHSLSPWKLPGNFFFWSHQQKSTNFLGILNQQHSLILRIWTPYSSPLLLVFTHWEEHKELKFLQRFVIVTVNKAIADSEIKIISF